METVEIKEAVDALGEAFEAFKTANDERLDQIEKNGVADPTTEAKLAKITKSLDQFEDLNQRLTLEAEARKNVEIEQKEQLDNIETALKRVGRGPAEDKAIMAMEQKEAFLAWCRYGEDKLTPDQVKALTVGSDTTGGYLAPSEYVREIIKAVVEFSPIRTIARIRSTGQRSVQHPKRTGVFAAQWTAERGTKTETTGLLYGLEEIPAHEMYALVDISEQDLEDPLFNLEAELNMEFAEQFGVAEGTAFVNGNSVGKPEGFMTNSDVSSTVSGNTDTVSADGLITVQHAVKTAYARRAVFVLNRTTLGAIRKLKDGAGRYLWAPGLATGVPNSVLGAPYVEAPDMPDEGAGTYPVIFGDFRRAYIIIDRIVMSILRDPFTQAASGTVRFIARKRVGGQVVLAEAIRKLECST